MKKIIFLYLLVSSTFALAFPEAPHNALKSKVIPPLSAEALSYDFEAIVKLSNCSGAVIHFKGQSLDSIPKAIEFA